MSLELMYMQITEVQKYNSKLKHNNKVKFKMAIKKDESKNRSKQKNVYKSLNSARSKATFTKNSGFHWAIFANPVCCLGHVSGSLLHFLFRALLTVSIHLWFSTVLSTKSWAGRAKAELVVRDRRLRRFTRRQTEQASLRQVNHL